MLSAVKRSLLLLTPMIEFLPVEIHLSLPGMLKYDNDKWFPIKDLLLPASSTWVVVVSSDTVENVIVHVDAENTKFWGVNLLQETIDPFPWRNCRMWFVEDLIGAIDGP